MSSLIKLFGAGAIMGATFASGSLTLVVRDGSLPELSFEGSDEAAGNLPQLPDLHDRDEETGEIQNRNRPRGDYAMLILQFLEQHPEITALRWNEISSNIIDIIGRRLGMLKHLKKIELGTRSDLACVSNAILHLSATIVNNLTSHLSHLEELKIESLRKCRKQVNSEAVSALAGALRAPQKGWTPGRPFKLSCAFEGEDDDGVGNRIFPIFNAASEGNWVTELDFGRVSCESPARYHGFPNLELNSTLKKVTLGKLSFDNESLEFLKESVAGNQTIEELNMTLCTPLCGSEKGECEETHDYSSALSEIFSHSFFKKTPNLETMSFGPDVGMPEEVEMRLRAPIVYRAELVAVEELEDSESSTWRFYCLNGECLDSAVVTVAGSDPSDPSVEEAMFLGLEKSLEEHYPEICRFTLVLPDGKDLTRSGFLSRQT